MATEQRGKLSYVMMFTLQCRAVIAYLTQTHIQAQ